ncbi:hypothetical protein GF337_05770 [candidate division KSB1 bacterium]|nr:hypothetical protein [candidate division KSB1 bacterium]
MKKLIITLLILAVSLSFTSMSFARWNDSGFKSSPLFKHALNNAIDRLEGKVNNVSEGDKPTSKAGCSDPKAEETLDHICDTSEITCEGTHTCIYWGTCMGGNTCYSTCPETCSGNTCESTCESTCIGGVCERYQFKGKMKWSYNDQSGENWFQIGNLIFPYYGQNGHSMYQAFDDEGSWQWENENRYLNYSNSNYSGERIRLTTNEGWDIYSEGTMLQIISGKYYIYPDTAGDHWNGPPVEYPNWNICNFLDDVTPPWE